MSEQSGIKRGKRAFVQIKAVGECDDRDRAVMSIGYTGKWIAKPDHTLTGLAGSLIRELLTFARWSSAEAMRADIHDLAALVDEMRTNAALAVEQAGAPSEAPR